MNLGVVFICLKNPTRFPNARIRGQKTTGEPKKEKKTTKESQSLGNVVDGSEIRLDHQLRFGSFSPLFNDGFLANILSVVV